MPEYRRWQMQGVVFVTLNLPGSPMLDARRSAALQTAALDWLEAALDQAERTAAAAMVIAFHASPDFASGAESRRYGWLLQRITEHALATACPLRHPADGLRLPHVTRPESHGSPWLGWSEIQLRPGSDTPFRILAHPYRRD